MLLFFNTLYFNRAYNVLVLTSATVVILITMWNKIFHMVNSVEYEVSIDRQGRIVIPAPIRKALGIIGGGKLLLRLRNGKVELIPVDKSLEERVSRWVEEVLKTKVEPFSEKVKEEWKWVSKDYAERKLGIL